MNAMIARIKLLGRIDVVEKRRPQDGRIKTRNPRGDEVEMRLSTLPTAFGEKMVMRIFDPDTAVKDLDALGFSQHDAKRWEALVQRPHGIILVTGPTGSGKTTTLYSTLKRVATEEVNVSTVEDPIEMIEPGLQPDAGAAAAGLQLCRRPARPDAPGPGHHHGGRNPRPGNRRDGHAGGADRSPGVLHPAHQRCAQSAITRLMELGVPAYLINATLLGVLAQRLVRTLCRQCRALDETAQRDWLEALVKPWKINGGYRPYKPVGCVDCRMTGFHGPHGPV
jgi:general secretion pathway protein E